MATTTAIAPVQSQHALDVAGNRLTRDQLELLKRTIAKGTTDDEFSLFVATANRLGLDPFARQIFAVKRWDSQEGREVMSIQISIDGFRVGAMRTGEVDGQEGPFWCSQDGGWREVWLDKEPPAAAKVIVYRKGCARPFVGVATYLSYVQRKKSGEVNSMWSRGPDFMLAKCAEALALRKAFPAELGGVITPEEAGSEDAEAKFGPVGPAHVAPAAAPSSPAAPATPAKSAEPPRPTLTEDDIVELVTAIGNCGTEATLRELMRARIVPAALDDAQRARLRTACEEQLEEIRAADKGAAS